MEIKKGNGPANNTDHRFAERIESLKDQMDKTTKNAKENINFIIASCATSYGKAIEANKKYVNDLRDQFREQHIDTSLFSEISCEFFNSLDVLDDVIDAIVDSYMHRTNRITEYYRKSIEELSNVQVSEQMNYEDCLKLFQKKIEQSIEHSTQNMKKIVDLYGNHLNLMVDFNKRFLDSLANSQMDTTVKFQSKDKQMTI